MQRRSEIVPIDSVQPYPGNARRGDLAIIRESLRYHGQFRDIVVQDSTKLVLAGNHTWLAAKEEGWTEIGVSFIEVDDNQAQKIVLVDNRANDVAGYDIPSLAELLKSVEDLDGTGFNQAALDEVMASLATPIFMGDPDDAPDVPDSDPITNLGDRYVLGDHVLVCGDATNADTFHLLMGEDRAQLLFADPPFNLNFDGFRVGKHRAKDSDKRTDAVMNDKQSDEDFFQFILDFLTLSVAHMDEKASAYVWIDWRKYDTIVQHFRTVLSHKNTIIWDKINIGIGHYNYRTQYEMLLFGVKGERPKTWTAGRKERDVWSVTRDNLKEYKHVNQKPVELAERAIRNSSSLGDVVLDPFGGSGTSMVACEGLDRKCRMIELDPRYCDVIVARWENMTGQKAVRNNENS